MLTFSSPSHNHDNETQTHRPQDYPSCLNFHFYVYPMNSDTSTATQLCQAFDLASNLPSTSSQVLQPIVLNQACDLLTYHTTNLPQEGYKFQQETNLNPLPDVQP